MTIGASRTSCEVRGLKCFFIFYLLLALILSYFLRSTRIEISEALLKRLKPWQSYFLRSTRIEIAIAGSLIGGTAASVSYFLRSTRIEILELKQDNTVVLTVVLLAKYED